MRRTGILIVVLMAVLASTAPAAIRFASIHYNSPGADNGSNKSLNKEWIKVSNHSNKAKKLTGWTIRDTSGHVSGQCHCCGL